MSASDGLPRSIFIPAPGSSLERHTAPGSAIVGLPMEPGAESAGSLVTIDLEGNLYGAMNLRLFRERVLHAWGRQATRYPTAARRAAPAEELIKIGETNGRGGVEWLDLPQAARWSGESEESLARPEPEPFSPRARPFSGGSRF